MSRTALALALLCNAAAVAAQSPLERRVTVHVRDVALRDALDRVAAAGEFRLSYSSDNLPLDRRVTVWRDTTPVGEILLELLRGFPVTPVVAAMDQIVLAPSAAEARDPTAAPVTVLDRVVVTGSVGGTVERSVPVALNVIPGREMERRGQSTLATIFDGSVPGVWMWEQAPTAMLARYGSIRGSSSFGVSFPKVYVDGIEVANPLLLTQITPELVERIEVIRGPQGAALYGADAISGVVNVVSRHDATASDGARRLVRSEAGYQSAFGANGVAVQQHVVSTRLGSNLKSLGASLGGSTSGAYVPHAYSRELRGAGDTRFIGARSSLTTLARFYGKDARVPTSPLITSLKAQLQDTLLQQESLRAYTIGSTYTYFPNEVWTLTGTAGVDGYMLSDASNDWGPIPTRLLTGDTGLFADTVLRNARGSATRATMRASGVAAVGDPNRVGGTLTFSGEVSSLHDRSPRDSGSSSGGSGASSHVVERSGNFGLTSQLDLGVRRTAYLRVGIRQEHIALPGGRSQLSLLPMLGGALVHDFGLVTGKVRAAYGRGIRAPNTTQRPRGIEGRRLKNDGLLPEEQSGVEGGFDLYFGSVFAAHVTRFDQTASGLIQEVTLVDSAGPPQNRKPYYISQLQNVGRISNAGWEAEASVVEGPWTLTGALATVDSRVEQLAFGYSGDLQPGDRMLGVPARTLTSTIAWAGRAVRLSSSVSRASDWVNYDRLAIATCIVETCVDKGKLSGPALRQYWANYSGSTRLRAAAAFDVRAGLTLTATGENLLNHQTGEPDSITIVPGRTITAGIRARF